MFAPVIKPERAYVMLIGNPLPFGYFTFASTS